MTKICEDRHSSILSEELMKQWVEKGFNFAKKKNKMQNSLKTEAIVQRHCPNILRKSKKKV